MGNSAGKRALVVGVGNEYRGDDAIGFAVVRRLRDDLTAFPELFEFEGDGVGLMQLWEGYDTVVLIDCVTANLPAGTIVRLDAAEHKMPTHYFRSSSHLFGVAEAIEMARTLGQLPGKLVVYGIVGQDFEAGCPLSPAVELTIESVVRQIKQELPLA